MYIYLNNSYQTKEKAAIFHNDRGFLLSDAIFETIKYANCKLIDFSKHLTRLKDSLMFLKINIPDNFENLEQICLNVINKNSLQQKTVAVRITVSRGQGSRGLSIDEKAIPTILVTAVKYLSNNLSISTYITSIKRNEFSPIVKIKSTQYLEQILAKQEAESLGFNDGIMLNTKGNITESTTANLFFIHQGPLILTPSINEGILPGIMRENIIATIKSLGLKLKETSVTVNDAYSAIEAFQTNSLVEIQSIKQINEHQLNFGDKANITNAIHSAYKKLIM